MNQNRSKLTKRYWKSWKEIRLLFIERHLLTKAQLIIKLKVENNPSTWYIVPGFELTTPRHHDHEQCDQIVRFS